MAKEDDNAKDQNKECQWKTFYVSIISPKETEYAFYAGYGLRIRKCDGEESDEYVRIDVYDCNSNNNGEIIELEIKYDFKEFPKWVDEYKGNFFLQLKESFDYEEFCHGKKYYEFTSDEFGYDPTNETFIKISGD